MSVQLPRAPITPNRHERKSGFKPKRDTRPAAAKAPHTPTGIALPPEIGASGRRISQRKVLKAKTPHHVPDLTPHPPKRKPVSPAEHKAAPRAEQTEHKHSTPEARLAGADAATQLQFQLYNAANESRSVVDKEILHDLHAKKVVVDRQSLSIDILAAGCIDSFVDFFYLTHAPNVSKNQYSTDSLRFLDSNLRTAEEAHRAGDVEEMFDAYERLASTFCDMGKDNEANYRTAVYFYEKGLDAVQAKHDAERQERACMYLGVTYGHMAQVGKAIEYHEKQLELAGTLPDPSRAANARKHLVQVYRLAAEQHQEAGETDQAIAMYKKCHKAAEEISDAKSQGVVLYKLGLVVFKQGDMHGAVQHLQECLDVCRELGDQVGEGATCFALAKCFKALGDHTVAIKFLETYLDIATQTEQTSAQAEACAALGNIYSVQGDNKNAVRFYEKTFDIAKTVGDRKLIDTARVNLGIARGNVALNRYMEVVNTDLERLLSWKTRRISFK